MYDQRGVLALKILRERERDGDLEWKVLNQIKYHSAYDRVKALAGLEAMLNRWRDTVFRNEAMKVEEL